MNGSTRSVTRSAPSSIGIPLTATPSSVSRATLWKVSISASGSEAAQTAAPGPVLELAVAGRPRPAATQPSRCAGASSRRPRRAPPRRSSRWSAERNRNARSTGAPSSASRASRAASPAASAAQVEADNPAPTRRVSVSGLMGRSVRLEWLALAGRCLSYGWEISSTSSPVCLSFASRATSAWATIPTSFPPSSTTGSRRT